MEENAMIAENEEKRSLPLVVPYCFNMRLQDEVEEKDLVMKKRFVTMTK